MTSAPVKDLSAMFVSTSTDRQTTKTLASSTDSFTQVMEKHTASQSSTTDSNQNRKQAVKSSTDTDTTQKTSDKTNSNETKKMEDSSQTEKTDSTAETKGTGALNDKMKEPKSTLEEKADKLVDEVANQLGVSKEDVVSMMEQMGLTPTDLLNTDNMTQLCLKLTGEPDMLSLLTNEQLYSNVSNLLETVTNTISDVQEQCQLTDDQMKQVLQQLTNNTQTEVPVADKTAASNQTVPGTIQSDKGIETVVTVEVTKDTLKQGVAEKTEVINTSDVTEAVVDETETVNTAENESALNDQNNQNSQNQNGKSSQENTQSLLQALNSQQVQQNQVPAETTVNAQLPLETPDMENILKQLADYVKVQMKPEITEMEMQLNPASLGTINLQIASKQGAITAQITVQNETVKTALETQIVQLRESLNEQGLKVESVEVTIASHAFERNLEQGQNQESQTEEGTKKGTRKINLDDLESLDLDQMDEADRISIDMMEQNGNTVDFTA